jgi:hypothetical protein
MATYLPQYSFTATMTSVHPDYRAALGFSRITSDVSRYQTGLKEEIRSAEYPFLCLNTSDPEQQKFWFLYHEWDDGQHSYEIKAQHPMFHSQKRSFKSLVVDTGEYIVPYPYADMAQGWRITRDHRCACPPVGKKPGKILYEVEPDELKTALIQTVRLNSPSGRDLQGYQRSSEGPAWWAHAVDEGGTTLPLRIDILQLGIAHPLE